MRRLITFILQLWVDTRAELPAWEGQIECVNDGKRQHIRAPDELLAFIDAHTSATPGCPQTGDEPSAPET